LQTEKEDVKRKRATTAQKDAAKKQGEDAGENINGGEHEEIREAATRR